MVVGMVPAPWDNHEAVVVGDCDAKTGQAGVASSLKKCAAPILHSASHVRVTWVDLPVSALFFLPPGPELAVIPESSDFFVGCTPLDSPWLSHVGWSRSEKHVDDRAKKAELVGQTEDKQSPLEWKLMLITTKADEVNWVVAEVIKLWRICRLLYDSVIFICYTLWKKFNV